MSLGEFPPKRLRYDVRKEREWTPPVTVKAVLPRRVVTQTTEMNPLDTWME